MPAEVEEHPAAVYATSERSGFGYRSSETMRKDGGRWAGARDHVLEPDARRGFEQTGRAAAAGLCSGRHVRQDDDRGIRDPAPAAYQGPYGPWLRPPRPRDRTAGRTSTM